MLSNYKIGTALSVLVLLLVLVLSRFNNLTRTNQYEIDKCRWSSDMKKLRLSGTIAKKMIDKSNHNNPTLEVSGSGGVKEIQFTNELTGFYDFAMIGDSVRKEAGSLKILVIRNGEIMEKELSYGCVEQVKTD